MTTTTDHEQPAWLADRAADFGSAGYWRGVPLGELMWQWADRYGDRTALVDRDARLGFAELARRADRLAEALGAAGIRQGDPVLVQLPNSWEFVAAFLACQRIGAVPVLALMPHRGRELHALAEQAGTRALLVAERWNDFDHQALAAEVAGPHPVFVLGERVWPGHLALGPLLADEAPQAAAARRARLDAHRPDPGRIALLLLSGGTTGHSKLVPRTHDDYEYNLRRSAEVCGFDQDTVYLAVLPAAHNFPLGSPGILGALGRGGRAVLSPSPRPETAFALAEREGATVSSVVPSIAQRWTEAVAAGATPPATLRTLQIGGSVLPPETAERIEAVLGCQVQQVYGMAEGLLCYTRPGDPAELRTTTQGRPISDGDRIRLVDEEDRPVPDGVPGELLTRGPYTVRGYYGAPAGAAAAFTPDGWYRTGDLVLRHPSGNLVVTGRIKDIINRGGEKIAAAELEEAAQSLPQVRQAAAVPVPEPELGERVGLAVTLRDGASLTLGELREAFRRRGLAGFRTPEHLLVLPRLPLTPVGKIDKKEIRRLLAAQTPS
ncbi:(2,3-dihydroxybenzoyl)adenylate synthase [Kitasatospora viridis]|uniref:2,3-dihydroxybenzoate-AMP ligase n=1 Tax=Kitasatospora viridis TaxID=281105 RepID=A0A561UCH4_9ACTN|nr:AMP-binding protein [Kitasatospora viridis]TWF97039.1 2,3-dihydroxybenzoate-AMP ligase [Kitasatospora viridis]